MKVYMQRCKAIIKNPFSSRQKTDINMFILLKITVISNVYGL